MTPFTSTTLFLPKHQERQQRQQNKNHNKHEQEQEQEQEINKTNKTNKTNRNSETMNVQPYVCYDLPQQSNHFYLTNLECVAMRMIDHYFPNLFPEFQSYRNLMINRLPKEYIKLVSINDEFVGIVRFEICQSTVTGHNVIVIDYIAVREEFRQRRIASLLIYEAICSVDNVGLIIIYGALEESFTSYQMMGFVQATNLKQRR